MSLLAEWVVQVASIVAATAATGAFGASAALWLQVRRHDRELYGEGDVDERPGLVAYVYEHRRALRREELLEDDSG